MRVKMTSQGFPTLTFSKLRKGQRLYSETKAAIATSPDLERRMLRSSDREAERPTEEVRNTGFGKFWQAMKVDYEETKERQFIGELPYVLYEAKEDNQKVTFRSCFPGTIMEWDATPLCDGEVYVATRGHVPSIKGEDDIVKKFLRSLVGTISGMNSLFADQMKFLNRKEFSEIMVPSKKPHGTLRAVRDSFLVAEFGVKATSYNTKKPTIKTYSETGDVFQEFKGKGKVYLEVHGDLVEIPLYPGEKVRVCPGYLLAFTDSIDLEITSAGDPLIAAAEERQFWIECTAGPKGGFVYLHSINVKEFAKRMK